MIRPSLGSSEDDLRLRSACLHAHLGDGLDAKDFIAFWDDLESYEEQLPIGITIGLLDHVDSSVAKAILEQIQGRAIPNSSVFASRRGPREASRLYEQLVAVTLPVTTDPQQAYDWFKSYMRRAQSHGQAGALDKAFKAFPDLGRKLLCAALTYADFSSTSDTSWVRFIHAMRSWLDPDDTLNEMLQAVCVASGERRSLIYKAALNESLRLGDKAAEQSAEFSALERRPPNFE
ncbi:hypothetical protein [Xanthomonas sp. NCPPB 4037]|uniref:hypothetical protein n=1 Tax=Xanthomonas sp. NCPPB 4037 TaxID=487568 RepID=UPI003556192F